MIQKEKLQPMLAEFVGTLLLALVVLTVSKMFSIGTAPWYISITAGATLALIVTKLGRVSGAHVNPAVTIGLWTLQKISSVNAVLYIVFQVLGGASALLLFNFLTDTKLPMPENTVFLWRAFTAEMIGAALFGSGIIAAVSQKLEGAYAAVTIGASLTFGAMIASLGSAGFLNPAVALANNGLNRVTLLAPLVGMVAGMQIYNWLFSPTETKKKTK